MKNVLNIADLVSGKFPEFNIPFIDGLENFNCSFYRLSDLYFFNENEYTQNILDKLDILSSNLLDFDYYTNDLDFNVGIYSRYFNEYFNSEEEYNHYIRESDVDFINLVKFENIEYFINTNADKFQLNEFINVRSESQFYIEREIEHYKDALKSLKQSFKELEEAIDEIVDNYNNEVLEYSSNALSVLEWQFTDQELFLFNEVLEYQDELNKKVELNNKLNDNLKEKGTSKKINKL